MTKTPASDRALLAGARRIVVKIGSKLVTESPAARPAAIADEIAALRAERGVEVVVVSSGAIALGMRVLGIAKRPTDMPTLQAIAAVGQRQLLYHWDHAFAAHRIVIGQVLITHDDIVDRTRFLNARHTLRALLGHAVVPVVNENDTVAVEEIKYGDNDMLGALVCNLISADALILLTDVAGLLDSDGARVPVVRDGDGASGLAGGAQRGGVGSGGMATKVAAARMVGRSGIPAVVAPGRESGVIRRVLDGEDLGTLFAPPADRMRSRKHWIAYAGKPAGAVQVDAGARRALVEQGRSLLPAGVIDVTGSFRVGDLVSVVDDAGVEFARGLTAYGAEELKKIRGCRTAEITEKLGYKYVDEVIHRDDLATI